MTALADRPVEAAPAPADRIRLHDNCRVCDVVNDPLPHKAHPRGQYTGPPVDRPVPAGVARYCRITGQDVPDWSEVLP